MARACMRCQVYYPYGDVCPQCGGPLVDYAPPPQTTDLALTSPAIQQPANPTSPASYPPPPPQQPVICPRCGNNVAGMNFCSNCGFSFACNLKQQPTKSNTEFNSVPPDHPVSKKAGPVDAPKNKKSVVVVICLGLVILGIIGFLADANQFMHYASSSSSSATEAATISPTQAQINAFCEWAYEINDQLIGMDTNLFVINNTDDGTTDLSEVQKKIDEYSINLTRLMASEDGQPLAAKIREEYPRIGELAENYYVALSGEYLDLMNGESLGLMDGESRNVQLSVSLWSEFKREVESNGFTVPEDN